MTRKKRTLRVTKRKHVNKDTIDVDASVHSKDEESSENCTSKLVEQLLCDAESEIDAFNYEAAAELCNKALKLNSESTKALQMLAGIMLESGNLLESESLLLRCIDLSPEDGYSKYFSLGQLANGKRALNFFIKGISIIEEGMKDPKHSVSEIHENTASKRALSDAHCSVAELYMTDLCYEQNGEELCKKAIESAIHTDPSNFEAYQCLTNYQLIKEDKEGAISTMKQSLSLWLPQYQNLLESQVDIVNSYEPPSYDSRISTSKLLIELEMYHEASEVLEGLVTEDDEVVEIWYLLGWLNYLQDEEYKRNARYYFKKAKEVYAKIGVADKDQMDHISELLSEMGNESESEGEIEENVPSDSESDEMET